MEIKFTKGPWTLDSTQQYIRAPKEDEAFIGGGAICEVQSPLAWGGMDVRVAQTRIANARLIAAAPDMYAVLEEWLDRQGTDENYLVAKARAALAKARSEA